MIKTIQRFLGCRRCDICKRWGVPNGKSPRGMLWVSRKISNEESAIQKALGVIVDICGNCVMTQRGREEFEKFGRDNAHK